MKRGDAYKWLAKRLGMSRRSCHIGMMDEETALRVVSVVAQGMETGTAMIAAAVGSNAGTPE